jgi:hypothetical protein
MTVVLAEVSLGLWGLQTYRCPHAVLLREVAERDRLPVRLRLREEVAHVYLRR